jgi:D-glycero-alpha-D-manno-heptose-7-phosphate kinase
MIIARSPLRISLGGGGTDLPSYYEKFGGFLVAGAINKYVYATVNRPFSAGIAVKYSRIENVAGVDEIQHPIIREALRLLNLRTPQIEISTIADIPAGTGLGSSGSFTTALLKAIYAHRRISIHSDELAELACRIEIEKLGEPIGKQDQYIAAYGGISSFTFNTDGSVNVTPLSLSQETMIDLEDNLLLFYTGISRSASNILKDQNTKSISDDAEMLDNLHFIKSLGIQSKSALEAGEVGRFGELMHEHWEHKKNRSAGMSNERINGLYELGRNNGAIGGKLVGAGGGGFLLFYTQDRARLRGAMLAAGLEELRFGFDFEGTKVILS